MPNQSNPPAASPTKPRFAVVLFRHVDGQRTYGPTVGPFTGPVHMDGSHLYADEEHLVAVLWGGATWRVCADMPKDKIQWPGGEALPTPVGGYNRLQIVNLPEDDVDRPVMVRLTVDVAVRSSIALLAYAESRRASWGLDDGEGRLAEEMVYISLLNNADKDILVTGCEIMDHRAVFWPDSETPPGPL